LPEHIISVENKIAKCSMCGEVVSFDEMSSHSRKRFGIDKICKKCNAKKTREYNEKFPDKKREMNKRYYDNNKEALLGKAKEYYGSNKETLLEKSKEYYSKNKEKIKVRVAEYRKTPKGKVVKINSSNKRREKEKQGSINSDDLIFLRENINSCEICGCELNDSNVHLDHIIPLSIGGAHRINNVRYICSSCNLQRPRDGKDIINKFEELSYSFSLKERTKELKTLIEYNKENYKTSWLNKNVITFQEDVFYSKEKELWDDYEVRKRIWINRSKYAD